jgi:hypothetical protein
MGATVEHGRGVRVATDVIQRPVGRPGTRARQRLTSRCLLTLLTIFGLAGPNGRLDAQVAPSTGPPECLGFAFGRFVPALDLVAAGHHHIPAPDKLEHAPDSRDWAARDSTDAGQMLMLYPSWWPVGVQVVLPRTSTSDTLRGVAYALVADGRITPPQAQVLAWPVPCGRASRATAPPPVARAAPPVNDSASVPTGKTPAPRPRSAPPPAKP